MWILALKGIGGFLLNHWRLIAICIAAAFAYLWIYNRGADSRQPEIDAVVAQHEAAIANANQERAIADAAARAKEAQWAAERATRAKELDDERRTNAEMQLALAKYRTTATQSRASADRLRDELATARLVARETAVDPAAACHARAGTYEALLARGEDLLRRGRDLVVRCAGAHDDRAPEVTSLVGSWPH
jgi:hypothetical protein